MFYELAASVYIGIYVSNFSRQIMAEIKTHNTGVNKQSYTAPLLGLNATKSRIYNAPTAPGKTPGVTTPAPDSKLYFLVSRVFGKRTQMAVEKVTDISKKNSKPSGSIEDLASTYPKLPGLSRNSSRN